MPNPNEKNPTTATKPSPTLNPDEIFKMPDSNEIEKLKEKYKQEGSKLFVVNLASGKTVIIRVVNRAIYMQYNQKLLTTQPSDGYKFAINFFTVHPEMTDQVYNLLLPGEVDALAEAIMTKHGYATPTVYEL